MALFQLGSGENIDDPASYTWGVFAQDVDELVERYGELIPPVNLADYHTTNLSAWISLRDAAQQRPDGDSYIGDYLAFLTEAHDELLRVSLRSYISEEEKERLSDEILLAKIRDFFGQDTYDASGSARQTFEELRQEEREVLALSECTPPLFFLHPDAETGSNEADRGALMALYIATDGPSWNENTNWATDAPIEEWHGVATDAAGRVSHLKLSQNRMSGEIPPELGALSSLRLLDLNNNLLRGEIPTQLGSLANLEVLALRSNELTGEIPLELGNLNNLHVLLLNGNELSGEIPPEIGNLAELELLMLGGNMLSGEIPPEIGNLTNLITLTLGGNQLTGGVPPWIGNLSNLGRLHLGSNPLGGQIPPEIGNLTQLTDLSLANSQLSGDIPPELGNLVNLRYLDPFRNELTGCYPENLREALRRVDASRAGAVRYCE
ncbi:MAG: hypothetical protein F4X20_07035 [Dehalococcoidia bacterium]|nr:hypothetical protein [Dehalococcoidia bacterium]